jgi:hypothetical protein
VRETALFQTSAWFHLGIANSPSVQVLTSFRHDDPKGRSMAADDGNDSLFRELLAGKRKFRVVDGRLVHYRPQPWREVMYFTLSTGVGCVLGMSALLLFVWLLNLVGAQLGAPVVKGAVPVVLLVVVVRHLSPAMLKSASEHKSDDWTAIHWSCVALIGLLEISACVWLVFLFS